VQITDFYDVFEVVAGLGLAALRPGLLGFQAASISRR
jgi:hypothetical protein